MGDLMPFYVRIPGCPPVCDLDFTLDDMDIIETESGVPWVLCSPFKQARVAKAYARAAYRIHGLDPDEVGTLTQRDMRGWFDYEPDQEDGPEGQPPGPTKGRKGRKRPPSSGGAPSGTGGPPPPPAGSGSETS
jgi:hypothetical protein